MLHQLLSFINPGKFAGYSITSIAKYRILNQIGYLIYYVRYMLPSIFVLQKTKALRNSRKRKKALVIGNGPSASKISLEQLQDLDRASVDVFATNSFLSSPLGTFVPDYMIFSDPLDFKPVSDDHPRKFRSDLGKPQRALAESLCSTIFAPVNQKKYCCGDQYLFFNDYENIHSSNVEDILKPRGYGSWTGTKALAIACYLGYSEIYFVGIDQDLFKSLMVDSTNKVYYEVAHFYDGESSKPYRFDKTSEGSAMPEVFYQLYLNYESFRKFDTNRVYNLNVDGFIDTFKKMRFEDSCLNAKR